MDHSSTGSRRSPDEHPNIPPLSPLKRLRCSLACVEQFAKDAATLATCDTGVIDDIDTLVRDVETAALFVDDARRIASFIQDHLDDFEGDVYPYWCGDALNEWADLVGTRFAKGGGA